MSTELPKRLDLSSTDSRAAVVADSRRTRPLFFDGKFLTAADLNREQGYLLTRQADLSRSLGFGVAEGLRVERSDKTASNVAGATASLRITAGHGLTPSGETVLLPRDTLVDLSDVPRLEGLNASFGLAQKPQQPFYNLSGLFVVGLRAVEFTANPTPVFPPGLQGNQSLQDGEVIEATAVTLIPYESAAALNDPNRARTRTAREIFLEQRPPKLPAGVLPLAMIYMRGGFLQWVDEFLVRREAGDDDRFGFGFAPRALAEAHFFHYRELLDEVPAASRPGRLAASDIFEILPPGGPLPSGTVDLTDFTQAFFPPEARVELTLVPEDELAGLMEESLDQPPIDLRVKPDDNDALAILVLAPVPRANFREALQQLKERKPLIRNVAPSLLGQQRPLEALQRLNELLASKKLGGAVTPPSPAALEAPIADAAWAKVLGPVPTLWYIRRRNVPYASDLAGSPLPASVPPVILVAPQSTLTNVGSNITLRVTAIGSAPLKYQWRNGGGNITGATNDTLNFPNVQTTDAAVYDVVVTNEAGSTTSAPAALTLREAPAITTQPADANTTVEKDVQLVVVARGTAPLRYQWRKGGTAIPGATTDILVLAKVQPADGADYDVIVSNDAGSVTSTTATLVVSPAPALVAPQITTQPQSIAAPAGTSVNFTVVAAGSPPLSYQWRRNAVNITGATDPSLTLNNIQAANSATYDVTVTNGAGSVVSTGAVLTVQPAPAVLAPAITGQPLSVTTPVNASVNFNVAVTGTAPLNFQWRKGGTDITGANSAALVLPNVGTADAASYDVVVGNSAGTVTSNPALLTIDRGPAEVPPSIATPPQNITTPPLATVNLTVAVTGTAPLRFQWRRNGVNLTGANKSALVLEGVQASQAGSYDVVVMNNAGTVTSVPALVTVEAPPAILPPVITQQPRNVTTPANATVNFDVAVTGTAPLRFQWRKNGVAISGATSATLALTNVQAANAGLYDVAVANDAASVTSSAATLIVEPAPAPQPPAFISQPQNVTTPANAGAIFSVGVTGTAPLAFQWRQNGVAIPGATSATLVLTNVQPTQAGSYDVVVTNNAGSVTSSTAVLTVEAMPAVVAPTITTQPQSIVAPPNAGVVFRVAVNGTAPFTYQWRKNGATIAGATGSALTLASIQPGDAGDYTGVVSNAAGSVTSAAASLTLESAPGAVAPLIVSQPQNVSTPPGATVHFSIGISGTAPLTIQWRRNGTPISGANSVTLVLPDVQLPAAGNYDVTVSNAAGTVTSTTAVLRIDVPPAAQPPVITRQPQSVTAPPQATVNFQVAASGTAPMKFQWRKNGVDIPGATSSSLILTNVTMVDAGTYEVGVLNEAGATTSAPATLTIEGDAPLVPPTITAQPLDVTAPPGTSVSFRAGVAGTAPFKFQWRLNGVDIAGATSASLNLTGVQAANAGRYDVLVGNGAGSIASNAASLEIEEAPFLEISRHPKSVTVAVEAPAGFDVLAKGAPSLTFQWFRTKPAGGPPIAIPNATKRTFKIEHVTGEDVGEYRVEVTNGAGLVQRSNPASLTITQ